jgi:hypothetical protein
MADFCKQCSIEIFNMDTKDLAFTRKIDGKPAQLKEGEGWASICEGCGFTLVLNDGTCISHTDEQHKEIWNG